MKAKWFFLFAYAALAVAIVHIGNDNNWRDLLRMPSYYSDLVLSLACTFVIGGYLNWLHNSPRSLNLRLLASGILLPALVVIGIEILYLVYYLRMPLAESSVFYLELPLVILFCAVINLWYLLRRPLHEAPILDTSFQEINPISYKDYFIVQSGNKSLNIALDRVAYFMIHQKLTFLVTTDQRRYLYDRTLTETAGEISPTDFFPLNRQYLVHRRSIVAYTRTQTRKLDVQLHPHAGQSVYVSKIKSPAFLKWLEEK